MSRQGCAQAAALSFIALVGLFLWVRHGEFWAIDRCLDSGGVWDYEAMQCRH